MRKTSTWNELLSEAVRLDNGQDSDIIAKAPADEAVWDEPFDAGFGGSEGKPVLAWSDTRVYFPVVYDGSEWIESAPRHPQKEGQGHVGGE